MKKTFTATLESGSGTGSMTFVRLPFDPKAVFGSARAPVVCTLNGKTTWRISVSMYGGEALLGVRAEVREAAGVKAGDRVKVALELDTKPRVVEAPKDLKAALKGARAKAWAKLSYTHQKEWVRALEDAKRPETRARRLAQLLEALG